MWRWRWRRRWWRKWAICNRDKTNRVKSPTDLTKCSDCVNIPRSYIRRGISTWSHNFKLADIITTFHGRLRPGTHTHPCAQSPNGEVNGRVKICTNWRTSFAFCVTIFNAEINKCGASESSWTNEEIVLLPLLLSTSYTRINSVDC